MNNYIFALLVVILFVVSTLVRSGGSQENILFILIAGAIYGAYLIDKRFIKKEEIARRDVILGLPVYVLLALVGLKNLDVIAVTDSLLWGSFAMCAIFAFGYFVKSGGHRL